jgi:signal transduction histidine kinase
MVMPEKPQADLGPDRTVLVVDDNADILAALAPALSKSFNVLVASDAAEAMRIIGNQPIDLLLTDIVMPGMNGLDLADRARSIRPDLRIIYMTGYSEDARHAERPMHGKLIPKPFRPAAMVAEVKSALGLAHELVQPLAAATSYLQAARRFIELGDPGSLERAKGGVESALRQIERSSEIIRRLRDLVTRANPERQPENVAAILEEARGQAILGTSTPGVDIHCRTAPGLPPALVDKIQIQQVLVNIVRNAIEAMRSSPRREITIEATPCSDGEVGIAIVDTGPGIAREIAARLFEPFVTTKADGMGVGLWLCRAIVQAHGGRLWAEPNPDGGTVFRFTIPAALTPPEPSLPLKGGA